MAKLEEFVDRYRLAGQTLYGRKPDGSRPTPKERENEKWVRRRIEMAIPHIRDLEKKRYGDVYRSRSTPVPKLVVEMLPDSGAGKVSYPDGSWTNYATVYFSNRSELKDVIALLVLQGIVDVDETKVIVGGSARPLLTLMAE
jgi:hypothetical protein